MKNIYLSIMKIIVSIFAWLLFITSAHAQWSTDPSINTPISIAANGQYWQTMVSDGAGGAIITWQDGRNIDISSYNITDIYAQRIDAAGVVQWTSDGVPICTDTMRQDNPKIISDGVGGAIMTWEDNRNGNADIYAQRINGAGVVQWQTNGVPIHTGAHTQWWPAIVSDGASGAIITWYDEEGFDSEDIYAQRINAAGVIQWTTDGVPICTEAGGQDYPTAVSDGIGGAIITWTDERTGGNNIWDIYAQRINSTGVVQWTMNGIPICTAANPQSSPAIASDGGNGAIIIWTDQRNINDENIYAQLITGTGITQWAVDGVAISSATNSQDGPEIVSDGAGGAIVTWYDYRNGYLNIDIYTQRINASGVVQWTTNGVPLCSAINEQSGQVIVSDGDNGAIVIWDDRRNANNPNLYAQRITGDGTTQWTIDGIVISSATEYQAYPVVISDGNGGAIIAWRDGRNTISFWDIYAQQVNANGELGIVTDVAEQPNLLLDFALQQNYPNPFNLSTKIKYTIPSTGASLMKFLQLNVYDVLGNEVATLVNEEKPAGSYEVEFDASRLSSGFYFYTLKAGSFTSIKKMVLIR